MESLESKLERLSPLQRKEVEDFVDFIIFRSGGPQVPPRMIQQAPPVLSQAPPARETVPQFHAQVSSVPRVQDLLLQDLPQDSPSGSIPVPSPVQESRSTGDDWIARDYMDYEQFEQSPSPATEAVEKVKQKISQREEHGKSHQLLDWID
jgi:hypothetical protein